jgi:hypothetical protein
MFESVKIIYPTHLLKEGAPIYQVIRAVTGFVGTLLHIKLANLQL